MGNGAVTPEARLQAQRAEWEALETMTGPGGARMRIVEGGVAAPLGFQAAGIHSGVKRQRKDLALVVSDRPAAAAATYTTNRVQAHPIRITREHIQAGPIRAIVCNSGNANACNGPQGDEDARQMTRDVAAVLSIKPEEVVVASTGVIGVPMPMEKIAAGIRAAAQVLSRDGASDAAEAIMTTDTVPKEVAVALEMGGRHVTIGAMAKGSGMIHPNMATMLAFVTTDAQVEPDLLQTMVSQAVDRTFNLVTVDGDTSTNDMVVCLANGAADHPPIAPDTQEAEAFAWALEWVMRHLARAIARDGEGATCLVEVQVTGAPDEAAARRIARSIAASNLVKTAVHGRDANWGRILCAAGYSGADFDPMRADLTIGGVLVASQGQGVAFDEEAAKQALIGPEVRIVLNLNSGLASATAWTCDLTADYIKINASYRT